jgi:malate dehydrogenase (oxaloacetate-decarboxylating)(NADP+)
MDRWKSVYAAADRGAAPSPMSLAARTYSWPFGAGCAQADMVERMAERPAYPGAGQSEPEIRPELARAARPDAVICTGRSITRTRSTTSICFPTSSGALDVGARSINEEMKMAAVRAIASLAREEPSDVVARAYGGEIGTFGPDYLIPSPFDQRLVLRIAPAVARAAMESGLAARPIEDFPAYFERLNSFVLRSGLIMRPMLAAAKTDRKRVIYAEGEDERVLRAAQIVIEEALASPILIGRPQVIAARAERFGLKIRPGRDFELVNPEDDPRYRDYVDEYFALVGRSGVNPEKRPRTAVRTNTT